MNKDFYFMNNGDDPFNYGYEKTSKLYREFSQYVTVEDELEEMIKDDILDIYVDEYGNFYYMLRKEIAEAVIGESSLSPKMTNFANMLKRRNLDINKYNRFKSMFRRNQ